MKGLAKSGDGYIYRNGWVLQVLVGLLTIMPGDRMSVIQARPPACACDL